MKLSIKLFSVKIVQDLDIDYRTRCHAREILIARVRRQEMGSGADSWQRSTTFYIIAIIEEKVELHAEI